ncbi:hypothetical protein BKA69DRAFT_120768 [Paraphysoderma sedebokerense]|nr:hypothetical protein BKA69DRAFT_120768 [Paraphysoderma sedebokerense]
MILIQQGIHSVRNSTSTSTDATCLTDAEFLLSQIELAWFRRTAHILQLSPQSSGVLLPDISVYLSDATTSPLEVSPIKDTSHAASLFEKDIISGVKITYDLLINQLLDVVCSMVEYSSPFTSHTDSMTDFDSADITSKGSLRLADLIKFILSSTFLFGSNEVKSPIWIVLERIEETTMKLYMTLKGCDGHCEPFASGLNTMVELLSRLLYIIEPICASLESDPLSNLNDNFTIHRLYNSVETIQHVLAQAHKTCQNDTNCSLNDNHFICELVFNLEGLCTRVNCIMGNIDAFVRHCRDLV